MTANRGTIFDRNMNILACARSVENVYLDPHELRQSKADIPMISRELGGILNLSEEWVAQQAADTTMRYKQIAAAVEPEVGAQIREFINKKEISRHFMSCY